MKPSCGCRSRSAIAMMDFSPSAISTTCARSCRDLVRPRCSTCRGCRSISASVSRSIPYIGLAASVGAVVLAGLTLITELMIREPTRAATGIQHGAHRARRNQPPQCRGAHGDGHDAPRVRTLERHQQEVHGEPAARERCGRRLRLHVEGPAHDAAVGRARRWRLSGDPPGSHRRHHHRRFDPERPGVGAGRPRHCELAIVRRRSAELAAADAALGAASCARRTDAVATAKQEPVGREPSVSPHRAATRSSCRRSALR